MTPRLQQLADNARGAILDSCAPDDLSELTNDPRAGAGELAKLLSFQNGFYGFRSSLLVRPARHKRLPLGVKEWNAPGLWKDTYDGMLDKVLCFAEDIFGCQFALAHDGIVSINPETGQPERVADDLEGWAAAILDDFGYRTGYPLAEEWQSQHGPLPAGKRLLPKRPFVVGGKFVAGNLYALDDVRGMQFRGSIARQIRDVPDGGHITLEMLSPPES